MMQYASIKMIKICHMVSNLALRVGPIFNKYSFLPNECKENLNAYLLCPYYPLLKLSKTPWPLIKMFRVGQRAAQKMSNLKYISTNNPYLKYI